MKKLVLLLMICLPFINVKAQNIAALKKDPDIIIVKNVMEKLKSYQYKLPLNYTSLITKNQSAEQMKVVLKKNGMVNADEFVDLMMSQRNAMLHFNQKHPEFKKMEPAKQIEVMKEVLVN